ncbi:MAG TPA: hypothetical protein VNH11_32765 [Pirellulales bacterium]|nr:hypothetical protein [Pirellulales bacterium]
MVFDQIESLKQQYTDKYVVVDDSRPELARFRGLAGRIKTVNMSGRALVEFDAYNNVGWYDIGLDFLKVVDEPPAKPAEAHAKPAKAAPAKKAEPGPKAAAGEKKLSPLEMARAQGAAKKPGEAPKKSTSDILAAARAGKSPTPAKAAPAAKAEAAPAAPDGEKKKLSTSEIIAAARAKAGAGAAPVAKAPEAAPPAPAASQPTTAEILAAARRKVAPAENAAPVEAPVAESPAEEASAATVAVEKPAKAIPAGDRPTTTAEKIAWCRQHDAK